MKRLLTVAAIAAGLTLLHTGVASAKPITPADGELSQTHTLADCGEVTITVTNTTKWLFEWTIKNVTTGESQTLTVDGRIADGTDTASVTLTVDEETTFSYGNTAGAESDWYLPFKTVVVKPCVVVTPPPTTTVPPTDTTPPPPSSSAPPTSSTGSIPPTTDKPSSSSSKAAPVHYADSANSKGDSGDLAYTGTSASLLWVVLAAVLLLGGGGALLYVTRRRRATGGTHRR